MGKKSRQKKAKRDTGHGRASGELSLTGRVVTSTPPTTPVRKPRFTSQVENLLAFKASPAAGLGVSRSDKLLSAYQQPGPEAALSVLEGVDTTQAERDMVASAGCGRRLITNNSAYAALLGSMIAFRQSYAVAYKELLDLIAAEPETVHPMTADFLVATAMRAAAKPFDEHDLMKGIMETVLPWLGGVVDRHVAADQKLQKEMMEVEQKNRAVKPVSVGFNYDPEADGTITRDRSLVLVGPARAVRFVLDQAVNACLADKEGFCVMRLAALVPEQKHFQRRMAIAGPKQWEGCANSRNWTGHKYNAVAGDTLGVLLSTQLSQPVDLLVVDDLAKAHCRGLVGRPPGADAGDAQAVFRLWANKAACAVLAGVPLDEHAAPDVSSPEYEQLRVFSNLRLVTVVDEGPGLAEGYRRVLVGSGFAYFDVTPEVLESYGRNNILLSALQTTGGPSGSP